MLLKLLQALLLVLALGGCSSISNTVSSYMGGEDNTKPPTPLEDIVQRVDIRKLWDKNTGAGTDKQYLKLIPVFYQGKLFVADSTGEVMAIDAANGKTIWKTDTDSPITGGPGTGESVVMVGTGNAEVISIAMDSGNILWRTRVTSEVLAPPQISGKIIIVRTIDGKIVGLNADDGNRIWVYDRTVPTLTLRGTSTPVISGDLVIAGFDEGRLTAIELQTGKPVWETRIALGSGRSELDRMVDIDSDPVIAGDIIYVATFQGRIAALDLTSGRILWTRDISSYAGVCVDDNAVYVTDDNSEIWALDRFSGTSIWKQEKLSARAVTAPENFGNMVVIGDLEGYVHWLDKNTGEIVARKRNSEDKIIAPPLSVDNVLYAYTTDGELTAYTSSQTDITFSYETPEETVISTENPDDTSDQEDISAQTDPEAVSTTSTSDQEKEEKGFFGRLFDSMFHDSED